MFILNDHLAEVVIQDIVNTGSAKTAQTSFITSFDIKNMANFYVMGSSSLLTYYYPKVNKNSIIESSNSQPPDNLVPAQK